MEIKHADVSDKTCCYWRHKITDVSDKTFCYWRYKIADVSDEIKTCCYWRNKMTAVSDKTCCYWWHKIIAVSDQQLWLPSRVSGPSTAPNNFSTNVFLASKSNHVWGNIISCGKKYWMIHHEIMRKQTQSRNSIDGHYQLSAAV